MNYQTFESLTTSLTETEQARSRCIICLSNAEYIIECGNTPTENGHSKSDIENQIEKSNSPLMDIRVLCGDNMDREMCCCRYNIHTSCFAESNKEFHNVCPMCHKKWWRNENETDTHDAVVNVNEYAGSSRNMVSSIIQFLKFVLIIFIESFTFTAFCVFIIVVVILTDK